MTADARTARALGGLPRFLRAGRLRLIFDGIECVRAVHQAEILRMKDDSALENYVVERVPYYYREPAAIADQFSEGYFLTAIRDTLRRMPTAESFQESHFGEILAGIYAEEVLGWRRLYSKLALLTAENANALKMDLLFYRPDTDPVAFVFAEVKSSMKTQADGHPPRHDQSCFADVFRSFNTYSENDLHFDLALIKERTTGVKEADRSRIKNALLPQHPRRIEYGAFCVIDVSTQHEPELPTLATRKNTKAFDVELLCVTELPAIVGAVYSRLQRLKEV